MALGSIHLANRRELESVCVRARVPRRAALVLALLPLLAAPALAADGIALIEGVEDGPRVHLEEGRAIVVTVLPEKGEGYLAVARRMCGDGDRAAALEAANLGMPLVEGRAVRVPWMLLRDEYRYLALRTVFPKDRFEDGAWRHRPRDAALLAHNVGLWQIAEWFTGRGESWQQIALANGAAGPGINGLDVVAIPEDLLSASFVPAPVGAGGALAYEGDARDGHAVYRLARGEALYSAVVLRFTGLVEPEDVNEAARRIAELNGIRDIRDIPVGFEVKVPFEMLAEPFLPPRHPRRVIAGLTSDEMERIGISPARATGSLAGIHVLIDPGHGGSDIGASRNRIWESDYVYDVACRVRRLLDRESGATVHMLVEDAEHGCRIFDRKRLVANKKEHVVTNPPHRPTGGSSTKVGVNLRWYLANAIYRELTRGQKVPRENVVFLSLHADSLHAALRGGMVYIPGANYRSGTQKGYGDARYRKFAEWKAKPKVSFSRKERLRDELISRKLATSLLEGYREEGLPVHLNRPIRDHVVRSVRRGKPRRWLPAVLRGNAVPAKVLVETVNINNAEDARLLEDPQGRERIARAIVRGLKRFYGEPPGSAAPPPGQRAARSSP